MFNNCKSLLYLPNISKWNVSNIYDMSNLCYNCSSLLTCPHISHWDIDKDTNINKMFTECINCMNLPKKFGEEYI